MKCEHCKYDLVGLPAHNEVTLCPECGRWSKPPNPAISTRDEFRAVAIGALPSISLLAALVLDILVNPRSQGKTGFLLNILAFLFILATVICPFVAAGNYWVRNPATRRWTTAVAVIFLSYAAIAIALAPFLLLMLRFAFSAVPSF